MAAFPSYTPTSPVTITTKPRVLKSDFGDGYSQRSSDGLNPFDRTLEMTFERLSAADATVIENFLAGCAGVTSFTFTIPLTSTTYSWVCPEWIRTLEHGNKSTISVRFEQVFDL